jgi:hypothetical protein
MDTTREARTDVRRAVLAVTITSFSIAALMGIAVLLGAGDLGDTGFRVLLSTVIVGCASVVTLCCLVVVGDRFAPVGVTGFLLTLGTTLLGLMLLWGSWDDISQGFGESYGVAITASLTLAQVCLLLGLAGPRRRLAPLMWATVLLSVVVAGMVSALIYEYDVSDGYVRTLGVIAILDVLGTVVTIALAVFGREPGELTVSISLTAETAGRLRALAADTGRSVSELADEALERAYGLPVD